MARLPTRRTLLQWIADNPDLASKRDIAKAFKLKGADRIALKQILRALEEDGRLQKRKKTYHDPENLPPVSVLKVMEATEDGDLLARPVEWDGAGPVPTVLLVLRAADAALAPGDRILARLQPVKGEAHGYEGRLIRRIGAVPKTILGVFREGGEGGRIVPIDKGFSREWRVPAGATCGAENGELVYAEQSGPKNRMGLAQARIIERLGDPGAPRSVSLIALRQHGLRDSFPEAVMAEASEKDAAALGDRVDLTELPLVTIDPSDARDHDDAVFAEPDTRGQNPGGYILWVAIADVAHYVRPGSELDREARARGNSTYFPDRVVPMLPDRLSGDLCSLHEGVVRPCLVARMVIDASGDLQETEFLRALMKSPASLHYEEVQAAIDGTPNTKTNPLLETVILPLYAAFGVLQKARAKRAPLELDLPERQVELDAAGKVQGVAYKERLDAHRLIEEFMVLANVAAAQTLIAKRTALLFRVHEEPAAEKLESLRKTAQASGMVLAKGQVLKTAHLNRLLQDAAASEDGELINLAVLRSMTQAYYAPQNFGHFGLALPAYAHFTSPIRRYADLLVHRALITAHGWGEDGLSEEDIAQLSETAEQISMTERRSMEAERDTTDRYLAAYLSERVGTEIGGRISGLQRFGAFVQLDETGADGLVPVRDLGREYFQYDKDSQTLMGVDTGLMISIGQRVLVRLKEAVPETGGVILELLELDGKPLPMGGSGRGRKATRGRRPARAAKKAAKTKRKVSRKRKSG